MGLSEVAAPRVREAVLVIDPADLAGRGARGGLDAPGRRLHVCNSAQEALALLGELEPDVIVVALDTPDLPGLRLVEALRARRPGTPLIAVADHPTVEGAVQALRAGAADYIGRPHAPELLAAKVGRALHEVRTTQSLAQAQANAADRYGFTHMLSQSPRMMRVFDAIRAVAQTDATVLIRGETGTGKELVARAIHERSRRRGSRLIGVNCGAFTETLLESELFGHEKGSFTGAIGRRQGVFEMADSGSLFLDELGETSLSVQVNLLRVLEEMSFRRVGGTDAVKVNVRVIAATNVDLESAVTEGRFREDLFYRLNVFPIVLPPLRERPEDIPLLMRHFLQDAAREYELPAPVVTPEAHELIVRYRWPGNVRQLRAMCERWVIQCHGDPLRPDALPPELAGGARPAEPTGALFVDDTVPLAQLTERLTNQLERAYLHKLLVRHGGHLQNTAGAAGITRRTLYSRMKALGLDAKDYK
jgi:DNA-binding NtrC family response regulator